MWDKRSRAREEGGLTGLVISGLQAEGRIELRWTFFGIEFMAASLVFTIIGADRPGLVEQIARTVNEHEANWLGSRMGQLSGMFAGMIQVEGDAAQLGRLKNALDSLPDLTVVVESGARDARLPGDPQRVVTMLGLDRPGIVREVSASLVLQNLNVLELETSVSQATMTGGLLFHGRAVVEAPQGQDWTKLAEELDRISISLGVDIELLEKE